MNNERNYGIDLLRLVLMFMVCMLHILGKGGALAASSGSMLSYGTFGFVKACCYCAVNGFAIISGYVSSKRAPRWNKLAEMWFQAFFYSFILTLLFNLVNIGRGIEIKNYIKLFLPVTSGCFWYFTAYFVLFFAMPLLDRFVEALDVNAARKAFIVIVVLFSFIGWPMDAFKAQSGYSAIWLMVMYCLGALAKKIDLFAKRKSITLIILFVISSLVSCGIKFAMGYGWLIKYSSPAMVLNGLILVVLFSRLKIKGTVVKRISPLAFGIYLFQQNVVIWHIVLKDRMSFIAGKPLPVMVACLILASAILFFGGMLVEFLRSQAAKLLRINVLSRKIAELFEKILSKATGILK